MGSALGFYGRGGMLVDQNRCAYIAYWKTLTKRAFLHIFVLKYTISNYVAL